MLRKTLPVLSALALAVSLGTQPAPAFAAGEAKSNQFWWPDQLNLEPLRQHGVESNPLGEDFDYAEAFKTIDQDKLKEEIEAVMTSSQDWWRLTMVTMVRSSFAWPGTVPVLTVCTTVEAVQVVVSSVSNHLTAGLIT